MLSIQSCHFWKASEHFFRKTFSGDCLLSFLLYLLFLFSLTLSHHPELPYFCSGEVYSWIRIRVLRGVDVFVIIFWSQLLFLQYLRCGPLYHSVVCCNSEEKIPGLLLNTLWSEYNHNIVCTGLLYLDRSYGMLCYWIDVFNLEYIRDLGGGNICLGVGGKVGRNEWE